MSIIQTNVSALNAHRNVAHTQSMLSKSIAKLSSGFRINRSADDAAGLSIANKLRSDVSAMRQAARNGAQANSVLSIADGAVQTLTTMVDRMKELAAQAGSDNVSDTQRDTLDLEFQELVTEFQRIVDTTKYQGSALLDGTFGNIVADSAGGSDILDNANVQSASMSGAASDTYTVTHTANTLTMENSAGSLTQVLDITGDDGINTFTFSHFGISFTTTSAFSAAMGGGAEASGDIVVTGDAAKFLVSISGDYAGDDQVQLTSVDINTATLGLDTEDLQSRGNAETALATLDTAITTLATAVGNIGAAQNRIGFSMASLSTTIENISAAESIIRDADMAYEMIDFTKQQILQQAGVAMLAQANAAPQGVLQLLAG